VLFIGTQFSNLYTAVDTPTRGRVGSLQNVVAWHLVEAGTWATDFAEAKAHRVPLIDHEAFAKDLNNRIRTMRRSSTDSVPAHRVCALLSSYSHQRRRVSVVICVCVYYCRT
jgi:hypothetical protein